MNPFCHLPFVLLNELPFSLTRQAIETAGHRPFLGTVATGESFYCVSTFLFFFFSSILSHFLS